MLRRNPLTVDRFDSRLMGLRIEIDWIMKEAPPTCDGPNDIGLKDCLLSCVSFNNGCLRNHSEGERSQVLGVLRALLG